jgi:CheY-like chemotaxis protein
MLRQLRILVVDDDAGIVEVLATCLEGRGHRVSSAYSGPDALDRLRSSTFDLLISDIEMAGVDGYTLVREARKRQPAIGIVLMTAYDDRYPMPEALRAGADGYITKPFSLRKFSLIFEEAYWAALSREDWWRAHAEEKDD